MLTDEDIFEIACNESLCEIKRSANKIDIYWKDNNLMEFARAIEAKTREADEALLRHALNSLEYHKSQTRPIYQTDTTIDAIRARLAKPGEAG